MTLQKFMACRSIAGDGTTVHALARRAARPPHSDRLADCGGGEMTNQINELFAKALGIAEPWFVKEVNFDAA
jgi:hypothetical protein